MSINDLEGHDYIIAKLKKLKRVSVPENFESEVMSKIYFPDGKFTGGRQKLIFGIIPFFIVMTAAAILLFYNFPVKYKDPVSLKPQPVKNSTPALTNGKTLSNNSFKEGFPGKSGSLNSVIKNRDSMVYYSKKNASAAGKSSKHLQKAAKAYK